MGIFKSPAEKELERRLDELDRFTGSLEEYNALKGSEHVIMDTKIAQKYVYIDAEKRRNISLLQQLLNKGCTGFIRYMSLSNNAYGGIFGGHGIPVKKK